MSANATACPSQRALHWPIVPLLPASAARYYCCWLLGPCRPVCYHDLFPCLIARLLCARLWPARALAVPGLLSALRKRTHPYVHPCHDHRLRLDRLSRCRLRALCLARFYQRHQTALAFAVPASEQERCLGPIPSVPCGSPPQTTPGTPLPRAAHSLRLGSRPSSSDLSWSGGLPAQSLGDFVSSRRTAAPGQRPPRSLLRRNQAVHCWRLGEQPRSKCN